MVVKGKGGKDREKWFPEFIRKAPYFKTQAYLLGYSGFKSQRTCVEPTVT
jgi:hypothetical protein